jgi:hypothetical protein
MKSIKIMMIPVVVMMMVCCASAQERPGRRPPRVPRNKPPVHPPQVFHEQEETAQLAVRFRGIAPSDEVDWDAGAGVELQARFWSRRTTGIALCLGFDSWDAPTEYVAEEDAFGYMESTIQGSATVVPVGISILCRSPVDRDSSFIFEMGLRYALVDSSLHADVLYEDETGPVHIAEDIDIDDAIFAVAGIAFEGVISRDVRLEGGCGYQFDLVKPSETYAGRDLGETSFGGVWFHLGLIFMF